jgi:AraC-like DNA-binding protein
MGIAYFQVDPEKLAGLLSLDEQRSLKRMAAREKHSVRCLSQHEPVAQHFRRLGLKPAASTSSMRLQLLQLFMEVVKSELDQAAAAALPELDGRGRLRRFLRETAGAEFLKLSLSDLAPKMNCSPRHLSRLFIEEVGVPFRRKQTDLRLAQACELLATTDLKVVEVAANSGYESVSLFSLLFKKYFGLSPGRWRERHRKTSPRRPKLERLAPLCA